MFLTFVKYSPHCPNRRGGDGRYSIKDFILEEVGGVDDGEDEDGGKVDGEDGVEEPPLEHHRHLQTQVCVAGILVGECPETIR